MKDTSSAPRRTPAVEPVIESRLLPRISFRLLFALMTVGALLAALARAAGQGGAVAYALIAATAYVAVCFVAFAVLFVFARGISVLWYQGPSSAAEGSPFAAEQLPPQILPPRNPED